MGKRTSTPRNFNLPLFCIIKIFYLTFLRLRYNISAKNTRMLRKLKPPYILIPNHVALLDPPFVNIFVHRRVHFVMGDSNLRSKFSQFLYLKMAAVIPKTKAMSDSATVRQMVRLARAGRIICVFAEGRSSWDGITHDIFFSTAKLIKMLQVPVVTPRIQGGYLSHPRWSPHPRRGKMVITYQKVFDGPELADLTAEEIHARLHAAMQNDDYEFQKTSGAIYKCKRGAEYLELVLFTCPECRGLQTLRSEKNRFFCTHCGFETHYTETGRLQPQNSQHPVWRVLDWSNWQTEFFFDYIEKHIAAGSREPLLTDQNVTLYSGYKLDPLKEVIHGEMRLYPDRFEVVAADGAKRVLPISEVAGVQVLLMNSFEFYHENTLYVFDFHSDRVSGYKYMLAIQKIAPDRTELE